MAHTVVQHLSGAQSSGIGAAFSLIFPSSPTNGNALWCICQNEDSSATPVSCTDDRGNTWTPITTINGSATYMSSTGPNPVRMAAWFCGKVTNGGATTTVTVTWSGGTSRKVMFIGEADGFPAAGAALDQCIGRETYGPANKISAGTFATFAQAEEVIAMQFNSNRNPTALDSGWTAGTTVDNFNYCRTARGITTGTTGISASWSIAESSAADHCIVALALKDASAGAAPTLTTATGGATGKDAGFSGATTDTASGTLYALPRIGGSAASAATIVATGTSLAITTTGAKTINHTGLTPGSAYSVDLCHAASGGNSNVVTYATFTPSAMTYSGTIGAQSGVVGTTFTWSGANPSTLFAGGIGSKTITENTALLAARGLSVNPTTGVISGTIGGSAGTDSISLKMTDSSTAGTEVPQTEVSNAFNMVFTAPSGTGTLTLAGFKQWTGAVHTSITVPYVKVFRLSTAALTLELADVSVNASGDMNITNASITAGLDYMVFGFNASGSMSFKKKVTAS